MPIYEYKCKICDTKVEKLQSVNDPPLVTCHICGQPTMKRVISAGVFNLKGEGFHKPGMN